MKKLLVIVLILLPFLTSCTKTLEIEVSNSLNMDRNDEMVEINLKNVIDGLNLSEKEPFILENSKGEELPYQITHDQKVIFQASVTAEGNTTFNIRKGQPKHFNVKACGKLYPERYDDLAWENDMVGFRAYGPALQKKGERGFGYDLFTKRGTTEPMLEKLYSTETDPKCWAKFSELRKTDKKAADAWLRKICYHYDKGYGMDCYAVGPTLGAGVAALVDDREIVYPWCYKTCEILDNGPLRFCARLVFNPLNIKGKEVIETRIITLDTGSHLNRTHITYSNLNEETPIVTGIVLHKNSDITSKDTEKGYIAYQDPTTGPDQGLIFLGHAFPEKIKDTRVSYFSEEELKIRGGARGHILAESTYHPENGFTYYWGFGWNRSDIQDFETWTAYMNNFSEKIKNPLKVSLN